MCILCRAVGGDMHLTTREQYFFSYNIFQFSEVIYFVQKNKDHEIEIGIQKHSLNMYIMYFLLKEFDIKKILSSWGSKPLQNP